MSTHLQSQPCASLVLLHALCEFSLGERDRTSLGQSFLEDEARRINAVEQNIPTRYMRNFHLLSSNALEPLSFPLLLYQNWVAEKSEDFLQNFHGRNRYLSLLDSSLGAPRSEMFNFFVM